MSTAQTDAPSPSGDASEPPFVGVERVALVDGLLACFDEVQSSGRPLWVSFEAPSGWGKTRVAREFYARLAAERQPDPAYWPPSILGSYSADDLDDVSARRKRVYPRVDHTPGSLPPFVWWGIAASVRNGVPSLALAEDVLQLEAHGPYIDDAWARLARWSERHPAWWKTPLTGAGRELFEFGIGMLVPLPGTGLIVPALRALTQRRAEAAARADRLETSDTITAPPIDIVDGTVETITKTARPGLPFVVFVEDAHLADPLLADVLQRLAQSDAAVLIVTTAWQGYVDASTRLGEVLATAEAEVIRITPDSATLPEPFPVGASFGPLADDDRASIIRAYYPLVDEATLTALLARYVSPLALELFCSLPRYRDRFPKGDLRLPPAEVAQLPGSLRDLYRALWVTLPSEVRKALTYASLSVPATLAGTEGADVMWHGGLLRETLLDVLAESDESLVDALDSEGPNRAWVRVVTSAMRQFHEAIQLQTASEDNDYLWDSDRNSFLAALATHLEVALDRDLTRAGTAGPGEPERTHRARLAIALHDRGYLSGRAFGKGVASLLSDLADEPYEVESRLAIAENWNLLGRPGEPAQHFSILADWVATLIVAERLTDALALEDEAVAYAAESFPPDDVRNLSVRRHRAWLLGVQGRVEEALAQFDEVIALARETLDPDSYSMFKMRHTHIAIRMQLTPNQELLDDAIRLEEDAARVLGNVNDLTLAGSLQAGLIAAQLENVEEGIRRLERALGAATVQFGRTHGDVINARLVLVGVLAQVDLERAGRLAKELAEDAALALGPRSPVAVLAMATAAEIEYMLTQSPEVELAMLERIDSAVALAMEIWGPASQTTVRVRIIRLNLSTHLDPEYVEREAAALHADIVAAFGAQSVLTSLLEVLLSSHDGEVDASGESMEHLAPTVRRGIASRRAAQTESADALLALLDQSVAERGALAPTTLDLREAYAGALEEDGDHEAALSEYSSLLFDRLRLLGARHDDVMQSMADVARQCLKLDRPTTASRLYGAAAVVSATTRGWHEPWAMLIRARSAFASLQAGRWGEAERRAREAYQRRLEAKGEDDPETKESHLAWVLALLKVEHVEEALVESSRALQARDPGGLDDAAVDVLRAHRLIALTAVGRIDEAREALDEVRAVYAEERQIWTVAGVIAHRAGDMDDAVEAYRRAAAFPDDDAAVPDAPGPFLEAAIVAAESGEPWSDTLHRLWRADTFTAPDDGDLRARPWAERVVALPTTDAPAEERVEALRALAVEMSVVAVPLMLIASGESTVLALFRSVLRDLARLERDVGRTLESAMTFRLDGDLVSDTLGADGISAATPYAAAARAFAELGRHEDVIAAAEQAERFLAPLTVTAGNDGLVRDDVLWRLGEGYRALGDATSALPVTATRLELAIALWGPDSERARWAALQRAYTLQTLERWNEMAEIAETFSTGADPEDRATGGLLRAATLARTRLAQAEEA